MTIKHAFCMLVLSLAAVGCQTATVPSTVVSQHGGAEPEAQLEFWHALAEAPLTSNDDAFHALLLAFNGEDPAGDYHARVELLRSKGWLPAGFGAPAEAAVERGTLAVALTEILGIDGGVMMNLLGGPRYATRELQHKNVYPRNSSPNQTFSGAEFVGIIARAEEHQQIESRPQQGDQP